MTYVALKKLAIALFILLVCMPVVATLPAQANPQNHLVGLQVIWMGVFNMPFVLVSVIALIVGVSFARPLKERAAKIAFIASICASIVGSLIMLAWGLGAL